jgi:hypothetical protein
MFEQKYKRGPTFGDVLLAKDSYGSGWKYVGALESFQQIDCENVITTIRKGTPPLNIPLPEL